MNNRSGIVRLTGFLCLVLTALVIVWYLLEIRVSTVPQEAAADLQRIAANPGRYLGFVSVEVLYNLGVIALGALFYLIFRRYRPSLAFFGLLGFLVTGVLWLVWDFPVMSQYELALEYAKTGGAAAGAIAQRASDLGLAFNFPAIIDYTAYGIGLIAFGAIIVRTRAIHRLLGFLALVLGIAYLLQWLGAITMIFGGGDVLKDSVYWDIVWYATDAWFLLTGLWLLAKGVKEAPATVGSSSTP